MRYNRSLAFALSILIVGIFSACELTNQSQQSSFPDQSIPELPVETESVGAAAEPASTELGGGLFLIRQGNEAHIANAEGMVIYPADRITVLEDEVAKIVVYNGEEGTGVINSAGQLVMLPEDCEVYAIHEGIGYAKRITSELPDYGVANDDLKSMGELHGLINAEGEVILPFLYEEITPFQGRIAIVYTLPSLSGAYRMFFINTEGEFLVEPYYPFYNYFDPDNRVSRMFIYPTQKGSGLVYRNEEGYMGSIDADKNTLIPFVYDEIIGYLDGYLGTKLDGKFGLIDLDNNIVIPFEIEVLGNGSGFRASENGYFDRNGFAKIVNTIRIYPQKTIYEGMDIIPHLYTLYQVAFFNEHGEVVFQSPMFMDEEEIIIGLQTHALSIRTNKYEIYDFSGREPMELDINGLYAYPGYGSEGYMLTGHPVYTVYRLGADTPVLNCTAAELEAIGAEMGLQTDGL